MTIKYLYITLFSFIVQSGSTQQSFTEEELNDFVNVYMSYKIEKKRTGNLDKKYFDLHQVTPQRYKEIASASLSNRPITLSPNEDQLITDLRNQDKLVKESNKKILEEICIEYAIPYPQYSAILNKYKTEIQFQRSLKPHFEAYIKRIR